MTDFKKTILKRLGWAVAAYLFLVLLKVEFSLPLQWDWVNLPLWYALGNIIGFFIPEMVECYEWVMNRYRWWRHRRAAKLLRDHFDLQIKKLDAIIEKLEKEEQDKDSHENNV